MENKEVIEAVVIAPVTVDLEAKLKEVSAELTQIKAQIKQVEEQQVQNQQKLQEAKDRLLSRGLELQGQERLLAELTGKSVAK